MIEKVDIKENKIYKLDPVILNLLLKDNTTKKNIIWATDNYVRKGNNYKFDSQIFDYLITGYNGETIKPRVKKSKEEQNDRIRNKAEVFTPSWVCNAQNNLIDEAWFGYKNVFNKSDNKSWKTTKKKIDFKNEKTWQDYVYDLRLEVSCGEAPYLVSRYDTVTGETIEVNNRIGLLDRKFRIINENVEEENDWNKWVIEAYKSVYGFEWQGDNLLLARENLLYTYIDNYVFKFDKIPSIEQQKEIANIISWNLWQMDGIKFVIPCSCKNEEVATQLNLFGDGEKEKLGCIGCKNNNYKKHNGTYSKIMNWKTNRSIKFMSLVK